MTQYNAPFDQPPVMERRTSGLAIASLVCAILGCCPFVTSALGVILGAAALAVIGRNPNLKGRGLALAGIILGLIGLVAWGWLSTVGARYFGDVGEFLEEGPEAAMQAVYNDDPDTFRSMADGSSATVSDAEIAAFKEELSQRYGAFRSAEMSTTTQPQYGQPVIPMAYELKFENATVPATFDIVFAPTTGGWPYNPPRIAAIRIEDEEQGDLVFPSAAGAAPSGGPPEMDQGEAPDAAEQAEPGGEADAETLEEEGG